jgi:hypothetical protein
MNNSNIILKPKAEEDIIKDMINDSSMNINQLLINSACRGFIQGVKLSLEQGADIHYLNDYALGYAAQDSHLEVVKPTAMLKMMQHYDMQKEIVIYLYVKY